MDLFRFIPGYRGVIFNEGKEPLFLLLVAFLIAFGATRGYTRLARKRGWGSASVGGFTSITAWSGSSSCSLPDSGSSRRWAPVR